MAGEFFAGFSFKWMKKFLKAIPEEKWYHKHVAFCLACCIHHQYVYKKQTTFKLTHKKLKLFCVNRQTLKRYLEIFQQAGLIKYSIQSKKSPIITLLLVPTSTYNNKQQINIYHPDVEKTQSPCRENDMQHVEKSTCSKITNKEPTKEPSKVKDILGPDKWSYGYSENFYSQIDQELERVLNKKKKVEVDECENV